MKEQYENQTGLKATYSIFGDAGHYICDAPTKEYLEWKSVTLQEAE